LRPRQGRRLRRHPRPRHVAWDRCGENEVSPAGTGGSKLNRPPSAASQSLVIAAGLAMVVASAGYTWQVNGETLTSGKPLRNLTEIVAEMLPPDPKVLPQLARPLVETAVMSVMATTLSALLAAPLAFLAARSTTPHPAISITIKGLFNAARTIPELIVA